MKRRRVNYAFVFLLLFSLLLTGCKGASAAPLNAVSTETEPQPPTDGFASPFSDDPSGEDATKAEDPLPDLPPPAKEDEPPSEHDTYIAVCAKTNVNVRTGASTDEAILFTLKKGDSLPLLKKIGNWYAVKKGDDVGYLYADYAYLAETSAALEKVIREGLKKIGIPYEWGAPRILTDKGTVNPYFTGKSFDCSSFVQYCYYKGAGIKLGNYTGSQADYTVGEKITTYSALRRGDFYFTGGSKISHVVIYLGGGLLLQTYSANDGPVSVTTDERWKTNFLSGRRPDLTVIKQFQ